ncbi:MAG: gliding motility-associated protein GldE [Cytophagales bacterium]
MDRLLFFENILLQIPEQSYSSVIVAFVAMAFLLFLSALISGAEVAFFSIGYNTKLSLENDSDKTNNKIAELLDAPQLLLATILILNNLFNITFVTLSTFVTWELSGGKTDPSILVTILVTFFIVFLGEVVPKVYANQEGLSLARLTVHLLSFFIKILYPISFVLLKLGDVLESRIKKKGYSFSVEELNQAIEITGDKEISEDEKEILKSIVKFGTISSKQVMQSRVDISALDYELDFHELLKNVEEIGYSRIPIYKENLDKIEGVLFVKDLLPFLHESKEYEWRTLLRPAYFIPENKKIDSLLRDFQTKRVHMAIVVDEYGGTSGLITMEDIIEEVVGEINDEYDEIFANSYKLDDYTYIFEGKLSINDFCKELEIENSIFDEVRGEAESIAGLILNLNESLPEKNQEIVFEDITFIPIWVDKKRIRRVKVKLKNNSEAEIEGKKNQN